MKNCAIDGSYAVNGCYFESCTIGIVGIFPRATGLRWFTLHLICTLFSPFLGESWSNDCIAYAMEPVAASTTVRTLIRSTFVCVYCFCVHAHTFARVLGRVYALKVDFFIAFVVALFFPCCGARYAQK